VFSAFGLTQQVHSPTRYNNVLDVLATDDLVVVNSLRVDDAGLISDHGVSALLPSRQPMLVEYRRLKDIDIGELERALRESSRFSARASSAAGYAEQIEQEVTTAINKFAPRVDVTVVHLSTSYTGYRRTPSTPSVNVASLNASGNGAAKRPTELRIVDRVAELTSSSMCLVSSSSMISSSRLLTARNAGGYPNCY